MILQGPDGVMGSKDGVVYPFPGRRVEPDEHGYQRGTLEPGDYVRVTATHIMEGGEWIPTPENWPWKKHYPMWIACSPNGHVANLCNHEIEEHEDGTISVSPSIAISDRHNQLWHGFLKQGVWRLPDDEGR